MGLDMDPLLLSHVYHVQGQYHRRWQGEEFGQQVQVPLQGGHVGHRHHNVGALADDVVASDAFFQ